MLRVSKNPEQRRADLISAAAKMFGCKGFEKTTVDDIVKASNVAKGTFYNYFSSKEQILEAIIEQLSNQSVHLAKSIVDDQNLSAIEKLKTVFFMIRSHFQENSMFIDDMHGFNDELFHYKSLSVFSIQLAPEMAKIIEQGINEKVFHTENPLELSEVILVASNYLLDDILFPALPERKISRLITIQHLLEQALVAKDGTFDFIRGE